jgi:threonylcarbamoyladenosine tRNA methylthiotransferase CDKAL1
MARACQDRRHYLKIQTITTHAHASSVISMSGDKLVYGENYGCSANTFDFGIMLAHLINMGYRITGNVNFTDIILVNTCAVKKPTEDRMIAKLCVLSRLNKPLIIAGCLPKINLKAVLKAAPDFSVILGPQSIDKTRLAIESAESGEKNRIFLSQKPIPKLEQPKTRLKPSIEIIAISEGCAGICAYCCVRFARGTLFSYPKEMIVERVRQAVSDGVKEIWITSQDNGAYGLDINTNLTELLGECCQVEGKFLIRVGMMNPSHVLQMLPELMGAYKNERIFKFLHLPVQSGDNEVLKRMTRQYTVEEFATIIDSFREKIPKITLSTDVICGFPGESEEGFGSTLQLVDQVQPDIVNISKFFPRPNTPAERMEQLDAREVKNRSLKLTRLVKKLSYKKNG